MDTPAARAGFPFAGRLVWGFAARSVRLTALMLRLLKLPVQAVRRDAVRRNAGRAVTLRDLLTSGWPIKISRLLRMGKATLNAAIRMIVG